MRAAVRFLAVGALALAAQIGCSCGPPGCPDEGFRLRYRFGDACAVGEITATTVLCRPLGTNYDSAAGQPSYAYRYEVFDAGGIPPAPVPTLIPNNVEPFVGEVRGLDGGPWPLSDGGAARAPDGGLFHYRDCLLLEILDGGNTTFDCTSYGAPLVDGAVNVRLDHCKSSGTLESRDVVPYE